VENAYLRPLVSQQSTAISWQICHLSLLNWVVFGLKFHLMADFKGLHPLVYLWSSPLPKVAVLFLVVDYDR
jgi:hypothetical protein